MAKEMRDFGEKIGGARKDFYRIALNVGDLESMNEAERQKFVKKDNIWKKYDEVAQVESGVPQGLAYWKNEIRKSLPATAAKCDPAYYVEIIGKIRDLVDGVKKPEDIGTLKEFLLEHYLVSSGKYRYSTTPEARGIITNNLFAASQHSYSEFEVKSWDDEKKDEAWTVFTTSEWNSMNIYFGASGNIAKADIPDEQIAIFKPLFQKVLNDDNVDGIYSAEEYLPLLLAIGNQLYLEQIGFGSMPDTERDVFGVNKYIYTTEQVEIKTPEQSAKYLVKRLIQCEKKLRTDGRDPEDLYQVNGCLKSLIQGVIYGPEYCGENYEYSSDNAKVYFDNHKDQMLFSDLDGKASFAENVAKNYTAIKVTVADE